MPPGAPQSSLWTPSPESQGLSAGVLVVIHVLGCCWRLPCGAGGDWGGPGPPPSADASASSVKVMPFANLMSLLGPSVDSVAVLRGIQKVAMLVQGNWVVKR